MAPRDNSLPDEPGAELQRTVAERRGHELSQASALGENSLRTYLLAIGKGTRIALVGGARTVQGFLKRDYTKSRRKPTTSVVG